LILLFRNDQSPTDDRFVARMSTGAVVVFFKVITQRLAT